MKFLTGTLSFVSLVLALASCASTPVVPTGIEVLINADHAHSRYCGHYLHETRWYYLANHKHGVGCGHESSATQGAWIIED